MHRNFNNVLAWSKCLMQDCLPALRLSSSFGLSMQTLPRIIIFNCRYNAMYELQFLSYSGSGAFNQPPEPNIENRSLQTIITLYTSSPTKLYYVYEPNIAKSKNEQFTMAEEYFSRFRYRCQTMQGVLYIEPQDLMKCRTVLHVMPKV